MTDCGPMIPSAPARGEKKAAAPGFAAPAGANPKDTQAAKKVDLSLLPVIAVAHGAHAMMDGARKYGPYNWRDKQVLARVYVAAAMRHLDQWLEGEELADDSGVHNLGGAIACCAILLDAQATGCLLDNRPQKGSCVVAALAALNAKIKAAFGL